MAQIDDGSAERRARGRPRDWNDKTDQNRIKSLDRAMEVLETLSRLGGATLTDLSAACDQAPASVYRVLVTLESRGIVDFDAGFQTWHIGAGAFLIGSRFLRRTSLLERARPVLRSLMAATGETANLGVRRDGQVLFLSQVETHESIRAFFPPGTMSPMHASGIGKALLAQMPVEEAARVTAAEGLTRFTHHTLTRPDALSADLAMTRRRGYAIDNEEKTLGMRCIAAPIFDVHGEAVAGISVSGPSARIPDEIIPEIGAKVIEAAKEVTKGIGGQPAG
ncbi:HTH-type transcriptional regulator BhcR [Thetidibacter halocola]|uniref:IclR family transcriptional regulator n=1 Tax=Thetidibacter halocola TaxID=2827239 RepID=A0A8J8B8E7_9RHOB|nr:HTH-type transcriptional regulator BhcR [Thetidibacter halocola]MBS0126136.1 IclR family transcriptional regulator [Thetidibacter halocola]